ncbi:hypothetical protein E2C01_081088 [Portunus trituberculatus]|uniref:Uncharacterized protein n=1 Tax=Portunus trituberculatus TaxID=210409 RepID=A0A5B7IUV8_PORTR|nr:hypothetical protein [Portunus trituberculatus]
MQSPGNMKGFILIPSVLGLIFTLKFVYDQTILFTLGRVYKGQKINGRSLHYFNPPHEFLKLYKATKQ